MYNAPSLSVQELSDKIAPVQLTIEEVNDQAARLADSGVPLSHANLQRLDDLNSRLVPILVLYILYVKELQVLYIYIYFAMKLI